MVRNNRIRLKFFTFCCVLWTMLPYSSFSSTELNLLYIEYPPYYETRPDGSVGGILFDIARKLFERAGVTCRYSSVPSKRVMLEMENGTAVASIGWFKTAEREKIAKFSLPIYQNKPPGIFMLREKMAQFARYDSIRQLMDSKLFKIGRIDGHSEGEYLDSVLWQHTDQTVWVAADEVQLIKMLKAGRFDFILLPPEEVEVLVKGAGYRMEDFLLQPMIDIPSGNTRHIMYSRSIDDELIKRIDEIIVEELGLLATG